MKSSHILSIFSFYTAAFSAALVGITGIAVADSGHWPDSTLGFYDGTRSVRYSANPNYRQGASALAEAKSTVAAGEDADVFVLFEFSTYAKYVYLRYTTDGSQPTKANGTTIAASHDKYVASSPERNWWFATLPASIHTPGTTIRYVFYISDGGLDPAWGLVDSAGYWTFWDEGAVSGFSYTVRYGTAQSGDWSWNTTWSGGVAPNSASADVEILRGHAVTLDSDFAVKSLRINQGATLNGGVAKTLSIASGGALANAGTFQHGTGIVSFAGAGTVAGAVEFNKVIVAGAVNFGANSSVTDVLQINTYGGVDTNPPVYGASSALLYNTGGTFTASSEWKAGATSGTGVPNNVTIANNTALSFGAASQPRAMSGTLTIESGSALTLSTEIGGDLSLGGDWAQSGGFTANQRTVAFNGTAAQTISGPARFGYLAIENASGVSILNNVALDRELEVRSGGVFHAGAHTITFDSWDGRGADLRLTSGTFDAGASLLDLTGSTLTDPHTFWGGASLNDVRLAGGGIEFFDNTSVQGVFEIRPGAYVDDYPPVFGAASTLRYNTGGPYTTGFSWLAGTSSGAGVPQDVHITGNTQVDFDADAQAHTMRGDLTIDPGAGLTLSNALGGDLRIEGDFMNGGVFDCNERAVFFIGAAAQNVAGNDLFDYVILDNPAGVKILSSMTIGSRLEIYGGGFTSDSAAPIYGATAQLVYRTSGPFTTGAEWSANATSGAGVPPEIRLRNNTDLQLGAQAGAARQAAGNLTIESGSTLRLSSAGAGEDLAVAGNLACDGALLPQGRTLIFNGKTTQNLAAGAPMALSALAVTSGTLLVETASADLVSVSGAIVNEGAIRKSRAVSGAGPLTFGLAAAAINVTSPGNLTSLQVDRRGGTAPNANAAIEPGIWWEISPTGDSYGLSLTLPHSLADASRAYLARWNGAAWEYARSSCAAGSVTLDGVSQLSRWAIATLDPKIDLNGAALAGAGYAVTFIRGGGAVHTEDAAAATIQDGDSSTLTRLVATLTNRPDGASESLAASPSGAIVAGDIAYTASTGELRIEPASPAPIADFQAVLRSVVYNNTEANPNLSERAILFVANDGAHDSLPATCTLTISLTNRTPTDIAVSPASVAENQAAGALVGTLSTTDPDAGQSFTYEFVSGAGGGDNALFAISGDELRTNAAFDYEARSSYSVRVKTTDNGSPAQSFEKALAISIIDVNEAPTDIALSVSNVDENLPVNSVVGALSTTDPDSGQSDTYSLVAGAGDTGNALFNIAGASLRTSAVLDYESAASHSIRVRTTDNGDPAQAFEKVFTIQVVDKNDPPVIAANAGLTVVRGASETISQTLLRATDSDNTASQLTYTVTTAPVHGQLLRGGIAISGTFTQSEIDLGQITYAHDGLTGASLDAFQFDLSDGAGAVLAGQTFNIHIAPPAAVLDWASNLND